MHELGLFTIGEVASILGVSAHAIRAWERRHGLIKPLRTASGQRRYRPEDVDLLRKVRQAIHVDRLSLRLAIGVVTGAQAIEAPVAANASGAASPPPAFDNENFWRGVVDVMPQLVFVVDPAGKVIEANIATARLFDSTLQQMRGRMFVDLVEPFDRAKASMMTGLTSRRMRGWELNLSLPGGGRMYSFESWPVRRGEDSFWVLIGSEMFARPLPQSNASAEVARHPEVTSADAYHRWLNDLLADRRFKQATTPRKLADVAKQHLETLCPEVEFVVAIAAPSGAAGGWSSAYSSPARRALRAEPGAVDAFQRAIRGAAAVGAAEEVPTTIRGRVNTVTAIPLSPRNKLGVLAWSRPAAAPLTTFQLRAIDTFATWVAVAAENLHARSESVRQASRFNDVLRAGATVSDRAEPEAIGASFLRQLASLVRADVVAVGRIAGDEFIVEAVYSAGLQRTKRGDRFRLLRVFSNALKTGKATRGTGVPRGMREDLRAAYAGVRHFLAVPLVFRGRASHMISLARFDDRPFSRTDAQIVQALAATARLAFQPASERQRRMRAGSAGVGSTPHRLAS
jgi:GAF domain-containing protein/PAS domain-containing protein